MKNLLYKEAVLATPVLTYCFLSFTIMTFIPGYPILCGAFFVCLGMFQGYQGARENDDILYSVLLPVRKADVVTAKYLWATLLQMTAFLFCALFTFIRMTVLRGAAVYETNALMNANGVFLAFVLVIFAAFNVIFIGGFFGTAHNIGKPFLKFVVVNFVIIALAETLHHLPGLMWLNLSDSTYAEQRLIILFAAFIIYIASTALSCRISQRRFKKTDL